MLSGHLNKIDPMLVMNIRFGLEPRTLLCKDTLSIPTCCFAFLIFLSGAVYLEQRELILLIFYVLQQDKKKKLLNISYLSLGKEMKKYISK
ncbi:hypothetical protein GDO81_000402 [Engystomops pustulosus]|uniref:Uncharacterized protein n=1 Tax=Engystomops pustulosus TaxID=76066 RepID=A0AAV7D5U6_ENGPU|nr:hypothetical protein GDO81_000402 [Engystomops pustulosus]